MSQAKVDRYKEEKKNRKKIMAKEKRMRIAGYIVGCLWKPFMQILIPLQTI